MGEGSKGRKLEESCSKRIELGWNSDDPGYAGVRIRWYLLFIYRVGVSKPNHF